MVDDIFLMLRHTKRILNHTKSMMKLPFSIVRDTFYMMVDR